MAPRSSERDMMDDRETEEEESEEDEDGDDDDEIGEMVGYLEDKPSAEEKLLLTRRMFPSKVGGKPAWLVPKNLPDVNCEKCTRPMRFLMQAYASKGEYNAEAFHRVVHLFVCTNCQPNEVRAFRAQLPRHNEYYSPDLPDEEKVAAQAHNDPEIEQLTCLDCGMPHATVVEEGVEEVSTSGAVGRCAECARRRRNGDGPAVFEEREISNAEACIPEDDDEEDEGDSQDSTAAEVDDNHRYDAAPEAPGTGALEGATAAMEHLAKSEDAPETSDALMQKLKEFRERAAVNAEEALDGSEQKVFDEWSKEKGEKDRTFSRFQRYSAENQAHMMRYVWAGRPLWFCGLNKFTQDPPPCPACGSKRVFEFQLQPQLISLLKDSPLANRLDFGTICVFVCSESCSHMDSPYMEEFVYVQPEPGDAWLPSS